MRTTRLIQWAHLLLTPAVLSDGVTVATFQEGFPAPVPIPIPLNGIIPLNSTLKGSNLFYIPLNFKNAYAESWNFVVQQGFRRNVSMQLAYVANHGVDISSAQNINLPVTYGGGNNSLPENIAFGHTGATFQYFQGRSSNYQSLQLSLNKRLSNGLAFTSALTWGKAMGYIANTGNAGSPDDGGVIFWINPRRNYAPLDFDRNVNFAQTFTYQLPFGRGHSMFSSRLGDAVLGGWQLSGILQFVTGLPFTVQTNGSNINTPGTAQTGQLTGVYRVTHQVGGGSNHWFDPSAFSTPSGCPAAPTVCTAQNAGVGNTARNAFRGPGYVQDNFSFFKSFHLFRETSLMTRFDALQLSNTPQFNNPTSNNCCTTTSSFGQVTSTLGSGQGAVNSIGGGRTLQASVKFLF